MSFQLRPLRDLCFPNIERINPATTPNNEFWYVDISSINNVSKSISSPTLTRGNNASVRARQLIKSGDVLVSTTRPNLNAVAIVQEEYDGQIASTGFCVLRCKEELDSSYLFHFVQSDAFVSSLSSLVQGALYPAVTDKQVFSQLIPWVPIEEQRQIAARLKAQLAEVDKARQAAEKRSFDFEKLKQSILNEAFKQQNHTHIGETQKLFNCCSFFCGGTPTKGKDEYWKGKIPWFSPRDMKVWNLTSSTYYINEAAILKSATRLVDSGTVLFVGRSGILAHSFPVGILRQPSTFNQDIKAIVSKGAYDAEYIAFFLLSMQSYILKEGVKRGPTVHSLLSGFIEQLEIPILSIEEQRQIAARLKAQLAEVDKARQVAEAQLREINLLPQKLLAQAFESAQP